MTRTGRFAPSPTGELHFGSLIASVASFLNARAHGGKWLVRIENIDPPREVPGSADHILRSLQAFGMRSDEPVMFQADRMPAHRSAMEQLLQNDLAYWCGCSRSELPATGIYPGTCNNGLPPGKSPRAVRLRSNGAIIHFNDRIRGDIEVNLENSVGDFIIWRADDLPAYQLAVAVDDAFQGVSEVVRGFDLLDSTARQIHVQRCLDLPTPVYAHHPVAATPDRQKLSKHLASDPATALPRAEALARVLNFLGQPCPEGLNFAKTWRWALQNWNLERVPRDELIIIEY